MDPEPYSRRTLGSAGALHISTIWSRVCGTGPCLLLSSFHLDQMPRSWKTMRPGESTEDSKVRAHPRSKGVSRRARSLRAASLTSCRSASDWKDSKLIESSIFVVSDRWVAIVFCIIEWVGSLRRERGRLLGNCDKPRLRSERGRLVPFLGRVIRGRPGKVAASGPGLWVRMRSQGLVHAPASLALILPHSGQHSNRAGCDAAIFGPWTVAALMNTICKRCKNRK